MCFSLISEFENLDQQLDRQVVRFCAVWNQTCCAGENVFQNISMAQSGFNSISPCHTMIHCKKDKTMELKTHHLEVEALKSK